MTPWPVMLFLILSIKVRKTSLAHSFSVMIQCMVVMCYLYVCYVLPVCLFMCYLFVLHYHLTTLGIAGIQVVVVGGDNIKMLVEKAKEHPVLKYVISINPKVPEDVVAMAKERNIELITFDEVMVSNTLHVTMAYYAV